MLSNSKTFVDKLIGNENSEILLLVRSDSVIMGGCRVVDVKLVQLRPGLRGEVLVWLCDRGHGMVGGGASEGWCSRLVGGAVLWIAHTQE